MQDNAEIVSALPPNVKQQMISKVKVKPY